MITYCVQPGMLVHALTTKLTPFDVQDCEEHVSPPMQSPELLQNCGPAQFV
jgi:hypothetical protein